MTLHIGMITGGDTPANAPTIERIQRMIAEADAANQGAASDFDLDLTFQVSGPMWQPPFYGVRAGRLAADRKLLPIKIGVPEAFPSPVERDRFLANAMRESMARAEEAVKRKRFDWSLSETHQIVDQVLKQSLVTPGQDSTAQSDGPGQVEPGGSTEPHDDCTGDTMLVKLYARGEDGWRYWEAWHAGSLVTIHTGRVGDRGRSSQLPVRTGQNARDVIRHEMLPQLDQGFEKLDEADQSTLIVQYPADYFSDMDHALRVWEEVERLLNEEFGWRGLGRCVNVDYSSELTFTAIAVEEGLGVATVREALAKAGYLDRAVIGVEKSGQYVAVWPEDRKGARIAY
jgi:hypothetical protein